MVTYYAAQLGIALSVVDSRHIFMEQAQRDKEIAAAKTEKHQGKQKTAVNSH